MAHSKNGRKQSPSVAKILAAGVLAAAVAGVGIAVGLTYPAGRPGQAAKRPSTTVALPAGVRLVAFTGGDHGAVAAADASPALPCALDRLATDFWTTQPAANSYLMSGITVTNTGVRCTLPTGLTAAAVVAASQVPVRQAGFTAPRALRQSASGPSMRSPTVASPLPEFANLATRKHGQETIVSGLPGMAVSVPRLTLSTGGKAVLVIASVFNPNVLQRHCLAAPASGGLTLTAAGSTLDVRIPIMPAPAGGPENGTGSAFYECSTSAISPFLTWDQASQVVGGPAVVTGPSGPLPNVDNPIYKLAP